MLSLRCPVAAGEAGGSDYPHAPDAGCSPYTGKVEGIENRNSQEPRLGEMRPVEENLRKSQQGEG